MDRKYCGKRRNCLLQAVSHFPTVFSKDLHCRHVKTRDCLGKGQTLDLVVVSSRPVEAKFLSGIFPPLISAEACEKSSWWLWKEICVSTGVRKPENTCASPTAMI